MFKAALKFHIASQGNFKLDKKQLRMTSVSFGVHSYGNWSSILGSESGKCWKKMRICLRMKWTKLSRLLMGTSYPVTGSSQRTRQVPLTESLSQIKQLCPTNPLADKILVGAERTILLSASSYLLSAAPPGCRSLYRHWSGRGGWHQEGPEIFEFPVDGWWWAAFILHSAHPWGHCKVESQDAQHNLQLGKFGGSTRDCWSVPFINSSVVYSQSANTIWH